MLMSVPRASVLIDGDICVIPAAANLSSSFDATKLTHPPNLPSVQHATAFVNG